MFIFVATDELAFVHFMEKRYGSARVWALDSKFLSDRLVPAHFMAGDGYEKGREALLTAIILSRCVMCVRGHSYLSAFSKILNPELRIIMLGEPFSPIPFPEVEILREAAECQKQLESLGNSMAVNSRLA